MSWTRSVDLVHWADTLDARAQLPLLLRRLVRRTVPSIKSLNLPAYEQIQRPGFDGQVEALEGNQFVPSGLSGWEMGVGENTKEKADYDYEKRTKEISLEDQKQRVFVFVTPRVWFKKDDWVKDKAPNSNWRGVVALDANDLEHWLEIAPDVDAWFTRLTGRVSHGVQDLESYWKAVQAIAEHPLAASVFTTSRDAEIAAVNKWLSDPPNSLFMRTNGLTDGLDFLAALSSGEGQDRLQNALIVFTAEAWRDLAASHQSLVLIAAPTLELQASDTAGAVKSGHYVFTSGPRGNVGLGLEETLRRQDFYSLSEALMGSGFSESPAMNLARACCGSSSILKRLITRHPESVFPPWSHDDRRTALAPFALVGGWTHVDPDVLPRDPKFPRIGSEPPIDVLFVSELVGCTRDELESPLARWQGGFEPLFIRFGNSVFVASREDAWYLLGGSLSDEQIKRFRDLAYLVLEEDNPAFELAREQRWMANLYGKTHSLSEDFRRSLVETLALMAIYPRADPAVANVDLKGTVRWVLERVLPPRAAWQRWASLGHNLTIIAEADPDFFLLRVEADLQSDDSALPKLFQDQSHSIFGGAIHSHLLWALEGLAWSAEYLPRVAVCLAKLAARDPGGTYANRPSNSLREIFLWWLWHTNALLGDRMSALSAVLQAEPMIGWMLLKHLLPKGHDTSMNTHMPRWRTWADGWSRGKIRRETVPYATAIADLTIQTAGLDAQRWSDVVDGMLRFSPEVNRKVFLALEKICEATDCSQEARFALWSQLQGLTSRHERYRDAGWAFDKKVRERLAKIRDQLRPADAVLKHHWLFNYQVELPGFDVLKDHIGHDKALAEARLAALREIIGGTGAAGVFRLLDLVSDVNTVGWLVGANDLLDYKSVDLPAILDTSDNRRLGFINAFIQSRFHADGWTFVNRLPIAEWSGHEFATFACSLPFRQDVWQWLQRFGADKALGYWRNRRPFVHDLNLEEVRIATTSFIDVGRAFAAIEVLRSALHDNLVLPSQLVAEVLEGGFSARNVESPDKSGHLQYSVQELVKYLQQDESFDALRLARIEWGFLPVLDPEFSETGPNTLVRAINSKPDFFVDLLETVYRGEKEQPPVKPMSEHDQLMARYASRLLDSLHQLPGTREDGTLDFEYFRNWITEVQSMAAERDRRAICDLTLGQFIARGTQKPDENWPSPELAGLMEEVGSDSLFDGFVNGVLNSRGVVTRDPRTGGELERRLIEWYRQLAENIRPASPRLAQAFLVLAHHYEAYAQHEDDRAERDRVGR